MATCANLQWLIAVPHVPSADAAGAATMQLSALQVPDDNKGAWAFQMLQYVKLQINPQVIVLPATAEAALLTAAKAPAAAAAGAAVDGEGSDEEMVLQLQRPSIFTYDKVQAKLPEPLGYFTDKGSMHVNKIVVLAVGVQEFYASNTTAKPAVWHINHVF